LAKSSRGWRQSHFLHIYALLALFSLVTIGIALFFHHRIATVFEESVAANRQWAGRHQQFSRLAELAGKMNAPANDVFESGNVALESQILEAVHTLVKDQAKRTAAEFKQDLEPDQAELLAADLRQFLSAVELMAGEANVIFSYLDQNRVPLARQRVAAMNRSYAEVNAILSRLQEHAALVQEGYLQRQLALVASTRSAQRWITVLAVLVIAGAVFYGIVLAKRVEADAREREEYLARLKEAEERVRNIFENAADGVFQWTPARGFTAANPSLARLYGFESPAELIEEGNRSGQDLLVGAERSAEFHRQLEDHGSIRGFEARIERKDGAPVWISVTARAVRDADGRSLFYEGFVHDVTERKEIDRMKSDFVSFATHQLRTPLSGIKWLLELAADAGDLSEEMRSYIEDARMSTDRLISLVNDLLDVTRLEGGKLKIDRRETRLDDLTRKIAEEMAPLIGGKKQRLSIDSLEGVPPVFVDPQLMRQVILNLMSNAVKYTPSSGEIRITLDRADDRIRWSIRDTGVGVPKQAQAKLFEKFFRADNVLTLETEGTGLGLYMIRLILEKFEGRVWCESEAGEGATFRFTLPLQAV
jgi:PAS domain S-box-containing protein